MNKALVFFLLLSLPFVGGALAMPSQEGCGGACNKCHSLTVQEANSILTGLGVEVKNVNPAAVNGLWELDVEQAGKQGVAYIDYGKKHLIPGPIFDIAARAPVSGAVNVPPPPPASVNVDTIPLTDSIVMGNPKGKKKLFVFTDPDCPYCAKMHGELKKLAAMEPDLAIYLKMFPLRMHPDAYDKARVILGARGKSLEMLDKAFSGQKLPQPGVKDVKKPVDETIKFAESIGINSTPTLVLPDGRIMPGFLEAAAIKELIAAGK
jgi:thiol:disulfide interchange protein DsbC